MENREVTVAEVVNALRLSRRYGGKFARDEFEYAYVLLDELEVEG